MNKVELVAAMAKRAGISKRDAEKALNAFVDTVQSEAKSGNKVQLVGFGTFELATQNARNCFGKIVPAKKVPKFRPGKTFKNAVAK